MTSIRERSEQFQQQMIAHRAREKAERAEERVREKARAKEPLGEAITNGVKQIVGGAGAILALGGVGLFAWQCYYWLAWGVWQSMSIIDVLSWASDTPQYDLTTGWLGLDKLLRWLPAPLTAVIVGAPLPAICDNP